MRKKHIILGTTLLAGLVAAPLAATPAMAAVGESVSGSAVIGGSIPGQHTQPFWVPGEVYSAGQKVSFHDKDYQLTAAGGAAYAGTSGLYKKSTSVKWSYAPEPFSVVDGSEITSYSSGAWQYIGPSSRLGSYRGEYSPYQHLYFDVNDTVTYQGKTYIALKWSVDVVPTNTEYFKLVG